MDSTPSTSNLDADSNQSQPKRRKNILNNNAIKRTSPKWKTPSEQQIYSSTLISALRRIRQRDGGDTVREAADKALAETARGRTRWSRAVLTSRLSRRLSQIHRVHKRARARRVKTRPGLVRPVEDKNEPGLTRKVRLLGKLVPGCNKVSFPKLLEETSDYIAALQMQVRAMSVIAEILSSGGGGASQPLV